MVEIVGITLKDGGKTYYFCPNGKQLDKGVKVIIETENGLQIGTVVTDLEKISKNNIKEPFNKVIRIASKNDIRKNNKNIRDSKKAIIVCEKIINNLNLNMKIVSANYNFDRSQLQFNFIADKRIDFRELVKKLASIYKTRIELRQIGVRDKARITGGIGPCGRELCCAKFLTNIENITINMAKNQNLSLNPSKINGACGRLLCCLKYEDDHYIESKKCLPKLGEKVTTEYGTGKVISLDVLNRSYKVEIEKVGIIDMEIKTNGCCK